MGIKSVPARFIRSEAMIFQDAVIRQLDRLNELGITVGMNTSRDAVGAYEMAIRDLHFMLYPAYSTPAYKKAYEFIEKNLKTSWKERAKLFRFEYLKQLQEWKGLLIKEFSQLDILPPSHIEMEMGDEDGDEDDGDAQDNAR